MSKNGETYKGLLKEFFEILNLPEFKEIDNRIKNIKLSDNTDVKSDDFILLILNKLSYLSDNEFNKVRNTLYNNVDLINKILSKIKSDNKLGVINNIIKENSDIETIIGYYKYEIQTENTTLMLLKKIFDCVSDMFK